MLPGRERYPGTTRNGVSSSNYDSYPASYRFQGNTSAAAATTEQPSAAASGQCPDNMSAYAGSSEVVTCACPAAQVGAGSVWGTDTYTADSGTCRAALHAGRVGRQGGTVTIEPIFPRWARLASERLLSDHFRSSGTLV